MLQRRRHGWRLRRPQSGAPRHEQAPAGWFTRLRARIGALLRVVLRSLRRRVDRSGAHRRRRVVLLLIALVVTLNTGLEAYLRKDLPTTTQPFTPSPARQQVAQRYFPQTYWVFIPGFGIDYCPDVERAYGDLISDTGQSFCVAPSPVALDPNEIAEAIRARVDRGRDGPGTPVTLRFYGISMGGMIAYDVARLLRERDRSIVVDAIVFDSSPAGPDSVSGLKQLGPRWGGLVNRTPNLPFDIPNPLKGGPLNRAGVHLVEAMADNVTSGRALLSWHDVRFAWYKATRVTGAGVVNQLAYLNAFFPPDWPAEDEEIAFGYFRAEDPAADTTVDVHRAEQTYQRLVDPRPLWVYPIPGGGHASADTTVAGYRSTLRAFISDARIPTVEDVRREALRISERNIPVGP